MRTSTSTRWSDFLLLALGAKDNSSRVLVLGAGGFLGQHVVTTLGERALAHARTPQLAASPALTADLADPDQLAQLLKSSTARALINCAAAASAACEGDPAMAATLNTDLPRALGEWAAREGARVVHVSTDLVFGTEPAPAGGFREEDEPAPVSAYGETKAGGERALLEACPKAMVVRLPLLYGDSYGSGRGASDDLFGILARGERARLFTDEWRTPLPVSVAAQALVELVDGETSGILHVAGSERVSRLELGLALHARRFGDPDKAVREIEGCARADLGLSPPRPEDTSLCTRRAQDILRTALPNLAEGARAALDPA
ncbi:MAG: sugar nucleotide-binding protein [Myxococcales bacterium]|nr:sugar nucleotide-binding protein [Myxococcales bacterium]